MESQADRQLFRYWVEIRELASGTVRKLSLTAVTRISLAREKTNEPPPSRDVVLHLQDGPEAVEAQNLDELASKLRDRYADGSFERTLHSERDRDAEERRKRAVDRLMDLLAQTVVREVIEEQSRSSSVRPRE
jgi:hypothetical protein